MPRSICFALAVLAAGPAAAEPILPMSKAGPAPLIDPVTLKVNEGMAKRVDAEQKARDVTWDARVRRTMAGVCRGC